MPQSGQEMLEETISTCKEIVKGLEGQNSDWESSIAEIMYKFEEVSETFFFRTMPSIPPTRTTMREAASLLELKRSEDWDAFSDSLVGLISSAQNVIEKAGMKGTTLT